MKNFTILPIVLIFLSIVSSEALGAPTSASDVEAAKSLSQEVGSWWAEMPDPKPKSITILSVRVSENLNSSFASLVESLILEQLIKKGPKDDQSRVINCQECKNPQVEVKDDQLIVSKGVPDYETQISIAKKLEVEAFFKIDVVKTYFNMQFNVMVFNAGSSAVFAAKEFSIPNITIGDSSLQIKVSGGVHWEYLPKRSSHRFEEFPISLNVMFLENLSASTKAGISFGAMLAAPHGHLGYIMPSLAWRINLGHSAISLSPSVQVGLGYRFITSSQVAKLTLSGEKVTSLGSIGATAGLGLDVTLGHYFFFGINNLLFLPFKQTTNSELSIYPGLHIGFSFGH